MTGSAAGPGPGGVVAAVPVWPDPPPVVAVARSGVPSPDVGNCQAAKQEQPEHGDDGTDDGQLEHRGLAIADLQGHS
ncbi:hypothetical protein [Phytohabitans houttuyneae]|uniref:hypothetical protein n=1 Tax=Phytohabitans houttuyneae TaxID=1076126 RepID=UPI00156747C6|nr:hypothetical protein [Phytohabitans houttuyneae]